MTRVLRPLVLLFVSLVACTASKARVQSAPPNAAGAVPVIWLDPGDIESRDLRHGPTSPERAPAPPFKFLEEDTGGTSPKLLVSDAENVRWQVKLGEEAQPETVATRLVWAVGYFAEEAYYLDRTRIEGLPRLSRGMEHTQPDGTIVGARFEPRHAEVERLDSWDWTNNPFVGTRELDGLKVLMVLLNNFDPLTRNNTIVLVRHPAGGRPEARYLVSDLGATLGGLDGAGGHRSKNNLEHFAEARFIEGVENGVVTFDYRTRPKNWMMVTFLVYPPYYLAEAKKERDMKGVTVDHARWIGSLLVRLSPEQLRDAFQAAGYDGDRTDRYVTLLRERIRRLTAL